MRHWKSAIISFDRPLMSTISVFKCAKVNLLVMGIGVDAIVLFRGDNCKLNNINHLVVNKKCMLQCSA